MGVDGGAMRLAGHRNASTHMRYVMRTGRLAAPTAALRTLRNQGNAGAYVPEATTRAIADPQSTNGTPTDGQSAVLAGLLEFGARAPKLKSNRGS